MTTKDELVKALQSLREETELIRLLQNVTAEELKRGCDYCGDEADIYINTPQRIVDLCLECFDALNCFLKDWGIEIEVNS
jgi:hypothetical protein